MFRRFKTNRIKSEPPKILDNHIIPDVDDLYVKHVMNTQKNLNTHIQKYREELQEKQNRINRLNNSIIGTHFILPFIPNNERRIDIPKELVKKRLELEGFNVSNFK